MVLYSVKNQKISWSCHVFLDGEEFGNGRMTISDILTKLGSTQDASEFEGKDPYDVLIIGGGPASGSAAIYTARKGLRTGIIVDRIGGQVNDTAASKTLSL